MYQHHQQCHSLDAQGLLCPQPLIQTRRLLKTLAAGEKFQVTVDNDIAHLNLMTFLKDQGMGPESAAADGEWTITATCQKSSQQASHSQVRQKPEIPAETSGKSTTEKLADYVVVLKSELMGQGDEDLGRILVKGYLNTLKEIDDKPSSIILYNGGARLATNASGADTALKALEEMGVDVIVCGACVDFFELQGKLAAGRISNMYEISEKVVAAGHVVYP